MNPSHVTIVAGLPIPADSPWFLAGVAVHVAAGLLCVATGAAAMLSRKGRGPHSAFGTAYYWGLAVVSGTAAVLSAARWADDHTLFLLAAASFAAASLGRAAIRDRWSQRVRLHIAGMGTSYIVLLTAFYVDNGRNLPVWKDLPAIIYWLAPGVIGLPIMLWALLRHPLVLRAGQNEA